MPQPDAALARRPAENEMLNITPGSLCGWGGGGKVPASIYSPKTSEELQRSISRVVKSPAITRGMGRSYGDAAQLGHGVVIDATSLKGVELDDRSGIVKAYAGVTIGELLDLVVSRGWIVPVVPGTQHVSVGGAIAGDIHGKNHGAAGTFGSRVLSLGLLTAAGEMLELEPHNELFQATLGGMGLTGVIVWARIALRKVHGAMLAVDSDRAADLDEVLAMLSEPGGPYRVAWLDLVDSQWGRGIVTRADHVSGFGRPTVKARATIPQWWPHWTLRPSAVAGFNTLRFHRAPRRERGRLESFGSHMFPLDALDAWPRLYGPRGFVQYQLVVPIGQERVLQAVIEQLRGASVPCYLAVLKDFGAANQAPLSFPIRGWTLALDLPRRAPGLLGALERCDQLVVEAGGRVYLSKDSRLRPEAVAAMYPRLQEWRAVRDRADPDRLWRSDLALRTGLVTP
jgi:decaprenylphospho-beta-D-ribofuranose 2-oxidase